MLLGIEPRQKAKIPVRAFVLVFFSSTLCKVLGTVPFSDSNIYFSLGKFYGRYAQAFCKEQQLNLEEVTKDGRES